MAIAIDTLAYAKRLREAGFTEEQAGAQAEALAAAMTDTLATKQDLHELELRMDARFAASDVRLAELEKRMEIRFDEQAARYAEQSARLDARLADLERRMTLRMFAAVGVLSALVKLL